MQEMHVYAVKVRLFEYNFES